MVGGIVVGFISGSPVSVSGPSPGLTAVILSAVGTLGGFQSVLGAVVLAGVIQVILGVIKAGDVTRFFPSPVIKGVLGAIGLILIMKQVPHLLGYDIEAFGVEEFVETATDLDANYAESKEEEAEAEKNTLTLLYHSVRHMHYGAAFIGFISLALLLALDWASKRFRDNVMLKTLPSTALVVVLGTALSVLLSRSRTKLSLSAHHLVNLPSVREYADVFGFKIPFRELVGNPEFYWAAISIALIIGYFKSSSQ